MPSVLKHVTSCLKSLSSRGAHRTFLLAFLVHLLFPAASVFEAGFSNSFRYLKYLVIMVFLLFKTDCCGGLTWQAAGHSLPWPTSPWLIVGRDALWCETSPGPAVPAASPRRSLCTPSLLSGRVVLLRNTEHPGSV